MTWRWEIWLLATVNGLDTETACNLQVRHQEALLTDSNAKLWSIPWQRFHECPKKPRRSVQNLQMEASSAILKPQCHPGETLIGRFIGDAYKFSCCSAGEQCAGCTEIQDGVCRQCSSGYVKQSIPILNKSKCFICDDLPRWTDAQGRTCDDYASLCNGSWPSPEVDQAFQGVRPSDACCACGGGNVFPTPVYMPLAGSVLHHSQVVNETPVPLTAEAIEVEEGCGLAAAGLRIASSGPGLGGVSGVVGKDAQPVHCSATVVQDPMRGLYFTVDLDLAVSAFSYGRAVVSFKSWGLQPVAAEEAQKPVEKAKALGLQEFSLDCNPTCPWLEIDAAGTLQYLPTGEGNLGAGVQDFPGMPACSCEVSALNASNTSKSLTTSFVALQARLWQGGAYEASAVEARVGEAMVPLQLQELLSPGLRFYTRAGHTTNLQVVENLTSHQRFAVPNAVSPAVLDVNCTGASLQLSWSRSTGDVELGGRLAFNLDPKTGALSGTPSADLLQATQGQASLQVACQVALGGDFYDRELPVATVAVKLLDDTCWVPSQPLAAVWKNAAASSQAACVRLCRVRANCAAASWANSICWLAVSDGTEPRVVPEALIRVNDCSKQKADLDLKVPGALFAAGKFSATNNYKDQVTFSRPGPTPERQLLLAHASVVQSELPAVCQNASWLLVHTNSSDYEDASTAAPEFFGGVLACASGDIVDLAFALGTVKMFWNFTEAHAGSHLQDATLSIAVPSCSKPDLAPGMVAGTPEEAALYSLQECECFGEAYATTAPVDADSNAAVSRSGAFNIGPLADQLIFSGPYTCESEAKITSLRNADSTVCQGECHRNSACHFYISEKATSLCTLFSRCDFLQLVDLPAANELWAKPPPDNFCRIADPESCWESVQRRSLLSFTPSDLPTCLFQTQYDACDALQILSGGSAGKCYRCQYFNVSSSFAQRSLKKVPFPEESPAGAQIQVGCNYTSRLFAEDGSSWEPGKSSTFTCVSGEWVGEDGAWQSLANLSCRACLQLGTPRLQRLSALQMPSIYFLEHRLAQFAKIAGEGQDGWGACPHAGFLTASPLLSGAMCLDVSGPSSVKLGSSCNASWWLDGHLRLRVKSEELDDTTGPWCLCSEGSEASHLAICECGVVEELGRWTLNNGRLEQLRGSRCVLNNQGKLTTKACPLKDDNRFQWHFNGGDCIFGMNLVDSAELTWNVSLPSQSGVESLLTEIRYLPVVAYAGVQYYFVQNSAYCLEASGNQVKVSYASPCSTSWLYEKQHVSISGTSAYLRAMPNGTVVLQEFAFGASGFSWEWSQGSLKNQDGKCLAAFRDATVETYVNYSSSVTAADDDTDLYDDGRNFRYSFGCNRENNFISQLWLPEKALMQQGGNEQHAASTQCEYLQGYNQWWKSCKEYVLFQDFDGGKYVRHALADIEALDCDAGYALSGLSMQYEHDVTPPFQVSWTCCPLPSEMPARNAPVSSKTQWYGTVSCPPNSVLSVFTFNDYFEFAGECTSFETIVSPNNPYFPVGAWTFPQVQVANCDYRAASWQKLPAPKSKNPRACALCQTLGRCEATLSVQNPEPPTFQALAGACEGLDALQVPYLMAEEVAWACTIRSRCFGYSLTSGQAGHMFLAPVKGSGAGESICHVKQLSDPSSLPSWSLSFNFRNDGIAQTTDYRRAPSIQIMAGQQAMFTCLPAQNLQQTQNLTSAIGCVSRESVSLFDLRNMSSFYLTDQVFGLKTEISRVCAALVQPSARTNPKTALPLELKAMTMKTVIGTLLSQSFHATQYSSPAAPPFRITGELDALNVGFLAVTPGSAMWGARCPDGAVIVSSPDMLPHCLQIDSSAEETEHSVLPGSAICPPGSLVSGWFNLPGAQVKEHGSGGPANYTGLQLYCRASDLVTLCQQPMNPSCQAGEVVSGISFSSHLQFKCCKLQRRLSMRLLGARRQANKYKDFEGYYCPSSVDSTGAAVYQKSRISQIGEPGTAFTPASLSWDKWTAHWQVTQGGAVVAQIASDVVSPLELNTTSQDPFSATLIEPLRGFIKQTPPAGPFPRKKPTYPVLQQFSAVQPDYAAYCDPVFLQNPALYAGEVAETNPCYHTFNAEPVVKGLPKGITERDFWGCSSREKARTVTATSATSHESHFQYEVDKEIQKTQQIFDAVALAAAIASAIPWGSYSSPASAAKKTAESAAKKTEEKILEKKIVQDLESHAKSFATKMKAYATKAVKLALKVENFTVSRYNQAAKTYQSVRSTPGRLENEANAAIAYPGQVRSHIQNKISQYESQAQNVVDDAKELKPIKVPSKAQEKNISADLSDKTLPQLSSPGGDSQADNAKKLANAGYADCMPLQFGLSKVMCDVFCVQNSVRAGTSAVLESLAESHQVLMTNLQSLLNYQTEYLLWAIGTRLPKPKASLWSREDVPSAMDVVAELRAAFHTIQSDQKGGLSRSLVEWHQGYSDVLLKRLSSLTHNASQANWPFRVKAMRNMLRHFKHSFQSKLSVGPQVQVLVDEKLEEVRRQAQDHRHLTNQAQLLRMHMTGDSLLSFDTSSQVLWSSLLDAFLRAHEKHSFFTMLRGQALDATDAALDMAKNFTQCGVDAAELRDAWQVAHQAERRAGEALQEAWAASMAAGERFQVAVQDEALLPRLIQGASLDFDVAASRGDCGDVSAAAQRLYSRALRAVDQALQPLVLQLITFKGLQGYQEHELKAKRLSYLQAPAVDLETVQQYLAEAADPNHPRGRALAARALTELGAKMCPAPVNCRGMAIWSDEAVWVTEDPASLLAGAAQLAPCRTGLMGIHSISGLMESAGILGAAPAPKVVLLAERPFSLELLSL